MYPIRKLKGIGDLKPIKTTISARFIDEFKDRNFLHKFKIFYNLSEYKAEVINKIVKSLKIYSKN